MKIKSIINLEGVEEEGKGIDFLGCASKSYCCCPQRKKKQQTFTNVYLQNEHSKPIFDGKCIPKGEERKRDVKAEIMLKVLYPCRPIVPMLVLYNGAEYCV